MKGKDDLFFTLWYGVYHPASRSLTMAAPAILPPALVDAVQSVKTIEGEGTCLSS